MPAAGCLYLRQAYADNSFLEVPDRVFVPPSSSIASTISGGLTGGGTLPGRGLAARASRQSASVEADGEPAEVPTRED
ncbi:hypothetical protein Taro_023266 [Colocasia esculenta]|uniref:Uncharacterized protein n=1 Tax=Colocasia esculenta TaxID=4460 RepID=A0A843V483_COLES|nr:hypothetical protein [Colocasia esculenta]